MKSKNFFDKAIDIFFDKEKIIVIGIFILGLLMRIFAAINIGPSPDNTNHAYRAFNIFNSGKLVSWDQSTSLYYYLQDSFFKIIGPTTLASRLNAVIFGSFLIIAMFIFVKKVFKSYKAALISSFLIAVSPIMIRETLPEMDVTASFFLILGAYFLFDYFEKRTYKPLILSAIVIGTGVMIKLYVLFFAISFLIFLAYKEYSYEKKISKDIIKKILVFGLIVSVLVLPTLAHNYLLYKDKGFLDLIFTNTFKLGTDKSKQFYEWNAGYLPYADYGGFFFGNQKNWGPTPIPGALLMFFDIFKGDPILFITGIASLIFIFNRKRDYFLFFLITFIPAFVYLGAQIPMVKHFIWTSALLAPSSGFLISNVLEKKNKITKYFIAIILIFNLFYLGTANSYGQTHFWGEAAYNKVIDYKKNIPDNALIVVDSRIYRGYIHWAFIDKNFVEAPLFFQIAKELNEKGNLQQTAVYYFECVSDDCGWGTIKNQPELNKTMEEIAKWFANISYKKEDFKGPDKRKYYFPFFVNEKEVEYRFYKTELQLNPEIFSAVKSAYFWWLSPRGYNRDISQIFDDYEVTGALDKLISVAAWIILYFEIFFSFSTLLIVTYLFFNDEKKKEIVDNNSGI